MKKLALLLMLALGSYVALAQSQTVKGTVVDQANEPVIGATVSVDGTKKAPLPIWTVTLSSLMFQRVQR